MNKQGQSYQRMAGQGATAAAGFTLIEVLLAVSLCGLMAVIGIAYLYQHGRQGQLDRSTAQLMHAARRCGMAAVEHQRACELRLYTAAGTYDVAIANHEPAAAVSPGNEPLALDASVRFEQVTVDGNAKGPAGPGTNRPADLPACTVIRFFPDGSAQAAKIRLSCGGEHRTVRIERATGQITATTAAAEQDLQTIDLAAQRIEPWPWKMP